MDLEELRAALHSKGLGHLADQAELLTLPAIQIDLKQMRRSNLPSCTAKVGGRPDLPLDMPWPQRNGRPLSHLAQFNLAEVAECDIEHALPSNGMLYFFYDCTNECCGVYPQDRDSWQVIYVDDSALTLHKPDWPTALPRRHRFPQSHVEFSNVLTITQEPDWVVGVLPSDDMRQRFREALERYYHPAGHLATEVSEGHDFEYWATRHQLLGHPFLVHYGTMPHACEYLVEGRPNPLFTGKRARLDFEPQESWDADIKAELTSAYKRWRLLFQLGNISGISSPPDVGERHRLWKMCELWARGGLMYFWIERDRLAQRDFSRVWMLCASQF